MSFKENNFLVIREAIDPKIANFLYNYFVLKRKVARVFFDTRYISQLNNDWGVWNDMQVPETYSHYADIAMETLLTEVMPIMEEKSQTKLIPTYSYARIYKKGDVLERHKDRPSCEISTTLNLGGDPWPIYIDPNPDNGNTNLGPDYVPGNSEGIKVELKPGDMLMYRGCELEHWRDKFDGENCAQVFLHYNDASDVKGRDNIYDTRPHLGLPSWFQGKIFEEV